MVNLFALMNMRESRLKQKRDADKQKQDMWNEQRKLKGDRMPQSVL